MELNKLRIGFALTGSFCTLAPCIESMRELKELGGDITPIMSETTYNTDTRFGKAADFISEIESITGMKPLHTLTEVEPVGPKKLFDVLIVSPMTGNSLSKLANGISDTAVTFCCKAHLRNASPLLLSVSTNDGLGINYKNIALLMNIKHIYFVPFGQDNASSKPNSLMANNALMVPALRAALNGLQLQPVLV